MSITPEDAHWNEDLEDRREMYRREQDNNRGILKGAPWWLNGILILGPTAAIALYMAWQQGQQLPRINQDLAAIQATLQADHEWRARQEMRDEQRLRVEQAICLNLAKTEAAAASCR